MSNPLDEQPTRSDAIWGVVEIWRPDFAVRITPMTWREWFRYQLWGRWFGA